MAETDAEKRAAMLNAIDMRRGSSALSQQVSQTSQLCPVVLFCHVQILWAKSYL